MAFTKVVGAGIHTLSNIASHNINSSGIITATKFVGPIEGDITAIDATFTGNVSIGGTLTYEDVKNVDSVGIITARSGIKDQTLTAGRIVLVDSDKTLTDNATLTYDGTYLDIGGGVTRFTKQGSYNSLEIGYGQNSNQNAFIDLIGDTTYTDYGARIIRYGQNGANGTTDILHRGTGSLNLQTSDAASIVFKTNGNNERVRIDSNGNIQLGSAQHGAGNALRYFDVYNLNTGTSAGSIIRLITTKSDGSSTTSADIVKYKTGGLVINNNEVLGTTGFISFGTGTAGGSVTPRLRIISDGKIGINEINPTEMLHIKAEDNTDSFGGIIVYANNNSVYTKHGWRGLDSNEAVRFAISGIEKMRLTNGGKLALGRTSADEMMHITHDDNTDGFGGIKIGANNGSVTVKYGWRGIDGSADLRFGVAGNEKVRITSTGNVQLQGGIIYGDDNASNVLKLQSTSGNANHSRIEIGASQSSDNGGIHFYTAGASTATRHMTLKGTSGHLGIGVDNPARDLHISNTTPYIRVESTSANQPATLELYHTRGNGSNKWPSSVSTADGALTLNVANGNDGAPQEKVRISANTLQFNSTAQQIHLSTTDGSDTGFLNIGAAGGQGTGNNQNRGAQAVFYGNEASSYQGQLGLLAGNSGNTNGYIYFKTGGDERLRITSDGKLLAAGADNYHGDADDLVLKERSGGNVGMTFQNTGTGYGVIYFADSGAQHSGRIQYDHSNDSLDLFTAGNEALSIDSSGRLLVNNASSTQAFSGGDDLIIGNTSSNTRSGITLVSNSSLDGGIYFSDGTSTGNANVQGQIVYDHNSSIMRLYTNSNERMRIASAGTVEFHGGDQGTEHIKVQSEAGGQGLYIANFQGVSDTGDSSSRLGVGKDDNILIFTNATASSAQVQNFAIGNTDSIPLVFSTANTKRLVITGAGQLQHQSATGISYFNGSSEYIFGSTTSSPPAGGYESPLQVHTSKTRSAFTLAAYNSNNGGPFMTFLSSRSTTRGTLGSKVNNGDTLGDIRFTGDNATNYNTVAFGARIMAKAASTPGDGDSVIAGRMMFSTGTANGGSDQTQMEIREDGHLMLRRGRVNNNGSVLYCWGGDIAGTGTFTLDIPVFTAGNIYRIDMFYSHHSLSYGCYKYGIYGAYSGHSGLQINNDISSHSSSLGGSFTVTRGSAGQPIVITKTAGTYGGTGKYFVNVYAGNYAAL